MYERPVAENVAIIMGIDGSDYDASTFSIDQKLIIVYKTVWIHLRKAGYTKKPTVCIPRESMRKKPFEPNFHLQITAESS